MKDKKTNLVLGVIRSYTFDQLKPFIISLQSSNFDGDLVFLWNDLSAQTIESLESNGVKLVHFTYRGSGSLNSWSRFWPVLAPLVRLSAGTITARKILQAILPLLTARFFACRDFLTAHSCKYENVFLTDVRDVLFQGNPFVGFDGGLLVFEEHSMIPLISEKLYNANWIEQLFGAEALAHFGNAPILCAGTTMGDITAILRYLAEFEKLVCRAKNISIYGSDQGIHNYLCRVIMDPWFEVSRNGHGQVLTMHPTLREGIDFQVSNQGRVVDLNGVVIPVLHQYDRFPELAARMIENFTATE